MDTKEDAKLNIKEAVILAAGNRKEFDRPVSFLEIEDFRVIDRQIKMLKNFGIEKIVIVTGYMSEYFDEIKKYNSCVELAYNESYKWTGNMASLALAKKHLKGDFILIENDLVFEDEAINSIINNSYKDCILITNESGSGDEAFVEIKDKCIYKVSKDIHQFNRIDGEMIGISKISQEFYSLMMDEFSMNMNPYVNYEYIILDASRKRKIYAQKVNDLVWGEIDNKRQYELLIKNIMPRLRRKEMAHRIDEVKNVLISALSVKDDEITAVSPIGGMTNNNYRVKENNNEYVIRIPGVGTTDMLNRSNEADNSNLVADINIDANILYYDEKTGTKISEMIKGAQTINAAMAKMPATMINISTILRRLHKSNIKMKNEFNVFENIELYENILDNLGGKYYDGYADVREKVFKLKDILKEKGSHLAPCHCDTVPENFIKDENERYYLIDWEYSGLNDPMWDIAAHSLECNFSKEEEELFLDLYFENKKHENEKIRVDIFKICQDFLWSTWTRIKEEQGENFGTYGIDRYNRCIKNIEILIKTL